ncbi:MAG TPA: GNAT family N-acetyltransferase [Thermoanaerobaculia bacterium]
MSELALREATLADADLLREWRNDPIVRQNSFTQDVIAPDTHRAWLERKLAANSGTKIWILTSDGEPAGQVRYDRDGDVAEVSVSIDGRFRGAGFGVAILTMSAPRACAEFGVREIRALVKLTNAPSLAAFTRAGFVRGADVDVHGDASASFAWRCAR